KDAIFTQDGRPVRFCFHNSVREGRDRIARDVEAHGGEIVNKERDADVLLVDEEENIELIRRRYYSSTDLYRHCIFIEPRGFVRCCIKYGRYEHEKPRKRRMPGPVPVAIGGHGRVDFTQEDDEHLAYYLATIYPDKATGGRLGNNVYLGLMDLANKPDYKWARRHTFHSWRERYKKHAKRLDQMIDEYAQRLRNIGHHLGQDPRSRQYRVARR
ncbi:hypothetical protein BU15DRAFT_24072, partial [Melanogaster broomeanus]